MTKNNFNRRDFLLAGAAGAAGLAATSMGMGTTYAAKSGNRRVVILFDSWNHMMPALAREMVRRNHDLVLGQARDQDLVKELRGMGAKVEVVEDTEDQSKLETFQKLVDRAQDAFGGFNSACIRTGTHVNASVLTGEEKDLDTVYEGNIKTVFHALRAVVPPLVEQKSGQVIINTSAGAMRPQPAQALYCATRAAANALVRATGLEVAAHGVTVNAIAPGYVRTDNTQALQDDPVRSQSILERIPAGRWGDPDDFKGPIVFLASDASRYMHGTIMTVDGGWMGR